eukprot:COSAG05_NODE_3782_length_1839_cov_26.770115_1_plen_90_part_00
MFPPWQLHSVLPSHYETGELGGSEGGGETAAEPQLRVSWAFNLMAKPQTRRQRGGSSTGGTPTGAAGAAAAAEFEGAQEDLLDELMDEL